MTTVRDYLDSADKSCKNVAAELEKLLSGKEVGDVRYARPTDDGNPAFALRCVSEAIEEIEKAKKLMGEP